MLKNPADAQDAAQEAMLKAWRAMPDFRAGERVFQLLTQASGRAGRGDKLGNVILQTRVPRHVSIVKTREQDYQGFAEYELATRKNLKYPPFARMLRIVVSAVDSNLAAECIREIRAKVHQAVQTEKLDIKILGPSPAPMARIKTLWRWHMILISSSPSVLNRVVREFGTER